MGAQSLFLWHGTHAFCMLLSIRGPIGVSLVAATVFIGLILMKTSAHRDCFEEHLLQEPLGQQRLNWRE